MEIETTPLIFLCYRRADSEVSAGWLYEWLESRLPPGSIYLDLLSSPAGKDWREHVARVLPHTKVAIVLIGKDWVGPYLFEKDNPVCFELALAESSHVPILPLLVNNADMPRKDQLPESINWFADRTALSLRPSLRDRPTDLADVEHTLRSHAGIRLAPPFNRSNRNATPQTLLYHNVVERARSQIEDAQSELRRGALYLDLGLRLQPDAVTPPYPRVGPPEELRQDPLPSGATLASIFAERRSLLLLGSSGAGKTTVVQQLGLTLLDTAKAQTDQADAPQPRCPLYLNLDTWALDAQSPTLDGWLLKRLQIDYSYPRRAAETIIKDVPLLLLLDGLDQVPSAAIPSCIAAINTYLAAHVYDTPLVVACRDDVYFGQSARLRVRTALHTQPLTSAQITAYLNRPDDPYTELHAALRDDDALAELSHTPLWLSLMAEVYAHGAKPPAPPVARSGTEEGITQTVAIETDPRRRLFARFVETRLDPQWRPRRKPTRGAEPAAEAPPAPKDAPEPILAPTLEPITVVYTPAEAQHWLVELAALLHREDRFRLYLEALQPRMAKHPRVVEWWAYLIYTVVAMMGIGVIIRFAFGSLAGAIFGAIFGLGSGLLSLGDIQIFDHFGFSWSDFRHEFANYFSWRNTFFKISLLGSPTVGLIVVGIFVIVNTPSGDWLVTLPLWLAAGFIVGLGGAVIGLLAISVGAGVVAAGGEATSYKPGKAPTYRAPNLGIARTGRRGLTFGLIAGSVVAILATLDNGRYHGALISLGDGLLVGGAMFLVIAILFGLGGWLKHWLLRFELAREGVTPYRYVRFLRYAHDRGLLLNFGNGFEFIHGSLRDYLASLAGGAGDQPTG